ncbi:MAG TPA: acyl carrier protein [Methylomirabilota bacterium]|nr:acyl carrier protein [Methylomirabilota bacterium]
MARDARAVIRGFVLGTLAAARGVEGVADDESLVERGVLDSLGIFELVAFLEERFGVRVPDEDITPENFRTIEDIGRLVTERER